MYDLQFHIAVNWEEIVSAWPRVKASKSQNLQSFSLTYSDITNTCTVCQWKAEEHSACQLTEANQSVWIIQAKIRVVSFLEISSALGEFLFFFLTGHLFLFVADWLQSLSTITLMTAGHLLPLRTSSEIPQVVSLSSTQWGSTFWTNPAASKAVLHFCSLLLALI